MRKKTFFSGNIVIAAPREFVFNFLTDFDNNVKWVDRLKEEDITPPEGGMVGTEIKQSIVIHGHTWHYEGKVIECREGEYLKIDLGDKKEKIQLEYTLTDDEYSKTLLNETGTIVEGTLIHRWLTGFDKSTLQKRLDKFKEVVEEEYKMR
ncbi:hypothetical protein PM10SUCC1_34690 [Propionigenium maris DSM 9537]|uniref:Polyketide cyclase / dehydrase and lipid transport n=1 Tax=Propionigenium maris DSM 9537 TaxID=1123000 RepID=A0A9W6GPF6_9FUSO|nr:SRPBCC family protein [Propionigenium maris]GLI57955.1 hypothetical protein PM10SUCC1_34690 [Propionigenium maris DSM 9537]